MDRGMIVESGTHAELMKLTGTYSQLVGIQNIKDTPAVHVPSLDPEACIDSPEPVGIALDDDEEALPLQHTEDIPADVEAPLFKSLWFIICQSMPKIDVLLVGISGASLLGLVNFIMVLMALKGASYMKDDTINLDDVVWNTSAAMILVSVCAGIFQLMSLIGLGLAAQKLSSRLRNQLFDDTLQQEIGWFDLDENSVGRLVAILSSGPQSIAGFYGETLGAFIFAIINTVSSCAICLYVSYKVALFMMLCYPLLVATSYISIHLISRFSRKSQKAYNHSTQLACESTSAIRTVASLTREDEVFKHYCASLKAPLRSGLKNAYISTIVIAMSAAVTPIIVASSFFFTANILTGYKPGFGMKPGFTSYELMMAILVLLIMTMSIVGTSRTVNLVYGIRKAKNAAKLCFKMSSRQPLIDSSDSSSGRMIGSGFEKYSCPIQGLIEFTDVHFHYPTRPNTMCLKGINFQVRPGQYIALVGPSGCGKSTTIGLIERFYDISNGSITIDGANISDLHLPSYRDHIALVGQEPALFNISIKDNILLGSRSYGEAPSMEDVIAAAKSANIHDFIISLPNGYDTLAGGKGMQMSGGQKQRIAIARALIRNPKVLLLDEATSALDADSEKVVQAALDAAAKGRTTISIAHRLSTIKRADLILVMKDGLIVERGTHDQLLSQNGLYCEMVQQQVLDRST
ncbi:hypothetical protein DSO57_1037954 [Entomophthora muscae]|uniref:Uncharacterized protein n=2 Tax=Entomophthora muscae TaxID=34485 RepID=A0ACC2TXW5_9FUNG|nr:hypothetical protein DSO57_1037954 [Entomophthora muscae]